MSNPNPIYTSEYTLSTFEADVLKGLQSSPKYLPSKYFYNEKGDELFRRIMELPEYYLTRTEYQILENNAEAIFSGMKKNQTFRLVELGAGDGMKTKVLLTYLYKSGFDFIYTPIDISENALILLKTDIQETFPGIKMETIQGEYIAALSDATFDDALPSFVLFLGSSIGNFSPEDTNRFFGKLYNSLKPGDYLLTGWDLQKHPKTILAAYNDSEGVTRDFNLNLLERMNEELGADFDISNFEHYPTYEPQTGLAKSFLIAKSAASYYFKGSQVRIPFAAGEHIFTEVSRKYTPDIIDSIRKAAGFISLEHWMDQHSFFIDTLWTRT